MLEEGDEGKEMVDEIKTSWRIPKELVKKFKHLATDRETNVTTLVIQAMNEYLSREKENRK